MLFTSSSKYTFGAPGGIRTPDLKVRSLAFYPAKLRAHLHNNYYTVILANFQVFFEIFLIIYYKFFQ